MLCIGHFRELADRQVVTSVWLTILYKEILENFKNSFNSILKFFNFQIQFR